MARDSGRRRNTHALDAQAGDLIELPSSAAKPAVRSRRVRAERAPADCAPVPLPSAGLCRERAVAHDVKARLSTVVTPGGSARHPIGRVHCSSVPAGETPCFPHDCWGAADRSTANGASTAGHQADRAGGGAPRLVVCRGDQIAALGSVRSRADGTGVTRRPNPFSDLPRRCTGQAPLALDPPPRSHIISTRRR